MVVRQARHSKKDEEFMRLALKLAEKGRGKTSPNPMVGAVVVKRSKILAKGYHRRFGGPHAEAVAVKACAEEAKGATLYITLEPCCYFGKTPPCTDLIVESGISRVVCATVDPNPKVNGKGIRILKRKGIKVNLGIMKEEAKRLNEVYFKHTATGLPFVALAVTQTLDGRITNQAAPAGARLRDIFLELPESEKSQIDAVLYDANGPALSPLNSFLQTTHSAKRKPILLGIRRESRNKIERLRKDRPIDPRSLLREAVHQGITSVLFLGGAGLATILLKQKLVDKVWYFVSPTLSGRGEDPFDDLKIKKISDAVALENCEHRQSRDGLVVVGYPAYAGR